MKKSSNRKHDLLTDIARAVGSSLGAVVAKTNALTGQDGHRATKATATRVAAKRARRQKAVGRRRSSRAS